MRPAEDHWAHWGHRWVEKRLLISLLVPKLKSIRCRLLGQHLKNLKKKNHFQRHLWSNLKINFFLALQRHLWMRNFQKFFLLLPFKRAIGSVCGVLVKEIFSLKILWKLSKRRKFYKSNWLAFGYAEVQIKLFWGRLRSFERWRSQKWSLKCFSWLDLKIFVVQKRKFKLQRSFSRWRSENLSSKEAFWGGEVKIKLQKDKKPNLRF